MFHALRRVSTGRIHLHCRIPKEYEISAADDIDDESAPALAD